MSEAIICPAGNDPLTAVPDARERFWRRVLAERGRQIQMYPPMRLDLHKLLAITNEEGLEVLELLNERDLIKSLLVLGRNVLDHDKRNKQKIGEELIHVAACCLKFHEHLHNGRA